MKKKTFVFRGIVTREDGEYVSLCPELDVASQGKTIAQAKKMLLDAVKGYLEICFENNLPYLRPVPQDENPMLANPQDVVSTFTIKADFKISAHV